MALIDESYFVGELQIVNTDKTHILERLENFINKYELEFLRDIMGYDLYKAYTAGIAVNPPDVKWTNIKAGVEYTGSDDRLHKWEGLAKPLANYVYYWWQKDQDTQTVGLGEVKTKGENSVNVSPIRKMVRAWNEMSDQVSSLYYYLNSNPDTYTEWRDYPYRYRTRISYRRVNEFGI